MISLCDDLSIRLGNLVTLEAYHVVLKSFMYCIIYYPRYLDGKIGHRKLIIYFCLHLSLAIVLKRIVISQKDT